MLKVIDNAMALAMVHHVTQPRFFENLPYSPRSTINMIFNGERFTKDIYSIGVGHGVQFTWFPMDILSNLFDDHDVH